MLKKLQALLFSILMCSTAYADWEENLKVMEVGMWTTGSTTIYIKFDRVIGPEACRNSIAKLSLGNENDPEVFLQAKNAIRSMALTAFAGSYNVKVSVKDSCLYGNPTLEQFYIVN